MWQHAWSKELKLIGLLYFRIDLKREKHELRKIKRSEVTEVWKGSIKLEKEYEKEKREGKWRKGKYAEEHLRNEILIETLYWTSTEETEEVWKKKCSDLDRKKVRKSTRKLQRHLKAFIISEMTPSIKSVTIGFDFFPPPLIFLVHLMLPLFPFFSFYFPFKKSVGIQPLKNELQPDKFEILRKLC